MDALARRADESGRAEPRAHGSGRPHTPILVTGSHRSGTGWVGQMLSASPTPVGYIWEPFSLEHRPGNCAVRFPLWFTYVCDENAALYRPAIERTLAWRYAPLAELRAVRSPKDLGRMPRDWYRFERNRRNHAIPLFKDPIAVFSAEWLAREFDMRVVMLLRHPAAFAASIKRLHRRHPFSHFTEQPLLMRDHLEPYADELYRYAAREQEIVDQAILLWNVIHHVIARLQDRHPEWHTARLEDLAREPRPRFRAMFEALDLPFDEGVDRFIELTTSPANPAEADRPQSVRRNSAEHVSNWKRRLSAEEIDRIRRGTEPVAARYYGPEDW